MTTPTPNTTSATSADAIRAPKIEDREAFEGQLRKALNSHAVDAIMDCLGKFGPMGLREPTNRGATPLLQAAQANSLECARLLLPFSDTNAGLPTNGETALIVAARNGVAPLVSLLLPVSDPNRKSTFGMTALMHAARLDSPECLNILMPASDAKAQNKEGRTALMAAAISGSPECVRALLPASDIDARDNLGRTALMLAAEMAESGLPNVQALLSHGNPDINLTDDNGDTAPAHAVSGKGDVRIVEALLPGSDISIRNHNRNSAFEFAMAARNHACVDAMSEKADRDAVERAFRMFGAEGMPRYAARLEAQELRVESGLPTRDAADDHAQMSEVSQKRHPSRI